MRNVCVALLGLVLSVAATAANAEAMTYGEYKNVLRSNGGNPPAYLRGYLDGLVHGMVSANVQLDQAHRQFCVPDHLTVDWETGARAVDEYAKEFRVADKLYMLNAVFMALQYTFPCQPSTR